MAKTADHAGVICPHCGYKHLDANRWCIETPCEQPCFECGKPFVCWVEEDVTYYALPLANRLLGVLREALQKK